MMRKNSSSKLCQVFVLLVLLCAFPYLSQSTPFSATGRRLMSIYKPNGGIVAEPSTSGRAHKRNNNYNGRRLMNIYYPNAGIRTPPSKSGQGSGRNPIAEP